MAEPTKAEQMKSLIEQLRQTLQIAAGGVDERVEAILQQMDQVLTPT